MSAQTLDRPPGAWRTAPVLLERYKSGAAMYTLAVCAEMVFRDLPIEERARRIHEAGFQVEIWDWTRHDLDALARTVAEVSSMTGYIRGPLADQDGAAELVRTAEESIKAAEHLGCPRLNLRGTGLDSEGLPVVPVTGDAGGEMWITAHRTLTRLAEPGESAGVTFTHPPIPTPSRTAGHPVAPRPTHDGMPCISPVDHPIPHVSSVRCRNEP